MSCQDEETAYSEIYNDEIFDDDGRPKRTGVYMYILTSSLSTPGTLVTTVAHIITTLIGSGILSLAWAVAQLGWIAGIIFLVIFSLITLFTSHLLADCYRAHSGKRSYSYMDAVKAKLGGLQMQLCGIIQYTYIFGESVRYTFVASTSIGAIKCSAKQQCHAYNSRFMMIFGMVQIVLSQIPNFRKLSFLSKIASAMSFTYSFIGIALSLARMFQGHGHFESTLTGAPDEDKIWNILSAIGDIAFAYSFSTNLINIQDTIKSSPQEKKVMKNAISLAITVTSKFYLLFALTGYAAFGNAVPGNLLAGFSSFKPFWVVVFAHMCLTVHLFGGYQVVSQPIYAFVESWSSQKWPENKFITREYTIIDGCYDFNFFRLVWRTVYVIVATIVAMVFPFFNHFVGLLGAIAFWPMTVYFPIEMYIAQRKVARFSRVWNGLQMLSLFCFIVSLLAAIGSVHGLVKSLYKTQASFAS